MQVIYYYRLQNECLNPVHTAAEQTWHADMEKQIYQVYFISELVESKCAATCSLLYMHALHWLVTPCDTIIISLVPQ